MKTSKTAAKPGTPLASARAEIKQLKAEVARLRATLGARRSPAVVGSSEEESE